MDTGECVVLIDPYLSDSVPGKRFMPVPAEVFEIKPDVIICTHNHGDHLDFETLKRFLNTDKRIDILCPENAYNDVLKYGFKQHNYVLFNRHTEYSVKNAVFKAVKAEHSDGTAIGVIVEADRKSIYITGDTLFNSEIFNDIEIKPDILFVCINGEGNNMNMADAARFSKRIRAKKVMPVHWGMFDNLDPGKFVKIYGNAEIPEFCERIYL